MQQPPDQPPTNYGQPQPPYQQYQQPYPPQQQYGPPPMYQPPQPAPKKSRLWLWIVLGVVGVLLLACIGGVIAVTSAAKTSVNALTTAVATSATSNVSSSSNSTPVPGGKWTTTHTFSGSGSKKTATFSVPGNWKINWSCKPSSFFGNQYNVVVIVYNSDGSMADPGAVNTICKAGNTHDSTEEHTSGQVYLDVASEGDWTIQVQELK